MLNSRENRSFPPSEIAIMQRPGSEWMNPARMSFWSAGCRATSAIGAEVTRAGEIPASIRRKVNRRISNSGVKTASTS
jgi:hypothetical protein